MPTISAKFDMSGIDAQLKDINQTAKHQMRAAAQAGAQVFYDEVKLRVPVAKAPHTTKSGRVVQPGALKASIYQVYSKDNSGDGFATFHVSWNARKAPHGHLVEFGTSRAAAHPFVRPAYDHAAKALQAALAAMAAGFNLKK